MRLTKLERKFCEEYVRTGSTSEAFANAGYAMPNTKAKMYTKITDVMSRPQVKAYIEEMKTKRSERVGISQDMVLRRLWLIATADANDLVAVKVSNCRHCWGNDFKYQFTDAEIEARIDEAERLKLEQPSMEGGGGFQTNRVPHPDCPRCGGAGKAKIMLKDTTDLKGSARLLYAGAEPTRNGVKVKMHNQLDALVKVADHLGMFESSTVEELRKANLAKVQEETKQLGKEIAPVKVEIKVVDASNPNRERTDDSESDS